MIEVESCPILSKLNIPDGGQPNLGSDRSATRKCVLKNELRIRALLPTRTMRKKSADRLLRRCRTRIPAGRERRAQHDLGGGKIACEDDKQ